MSEFKGLQGASSLGPNKESKMASTQQSNMTAVVENPRLIRKKRAHYNSMSHAGVNGLTLASGGTSNVVNILGNRAPYGKNSRKSRNGFRHGSRKASDKDVWDIACDELDELELDPNDPDYESEEESVDVLGKVKTTFNDEEFDKHVSDLIHEYYDHCRAGEVIEALQGIAMSSMQRRRLPVIAINLALQHKVGHCELTSELLSEMCGKVISMSGMQQGFRLLLDDMPDIVIDVPKAPDYIGRFIARAVADDILPPKFVQQYREINSVMPPAGSSPVMSDTVHPPVRIASRHNSTSISESGGATRSSSGVSSSCDANMVPPCGDETNYALKAIDIAESLLTSNHAYRHLDIVWGIPPNERVTTMLMKQIYAIIIHYVNGGNFEGVLSSLNDLDSPHFLHEVVYQAILIAMQYNEKDEVEVKMLELLDKLCRAVVISYDQLVTGVKRVYAELPTLQQELPVIYVLLERFMQKAVEMGFMPPKLAKEMPKNPRRRFVSEGDGIRKAGKVERV
ncbi:hypothetical protein Aperf_G00000024130 [Anoplocephala perfoliata]